MSNAADAPDAAPNADPDTAPGTAPNTASRPTGSQLVRVAVPTPLRRRFDYMVPESQDAPEPGMRVRVPFGRGNRVGVVLEHIDHTGVPAGRLKRITSIIDREPILDAASLSLLRWASDYFHHPIGEVVLGALPAGLAAGKPLPAGGEPCWRLTQEGARLEAQALARAPRRLEVWRFLRAHPGGARVSDLAALEGDWRGALAAMRTKGWVERGHLDACAPPAPAQCAPPARVSPNEEQRAAIEAVYAVRDRFHAFVLDGVTGSGKTEVYIELIERIVALGRQTLMLIPEIGLTPQIVARLKERLSVSMAVLHSGLSDGERRQAFAMAREGRASVVVGTRSAVFVPLPRPGLFIVDEEHDASFKQQDGFRYSARDLAVVRAHQCAVPVLLGSATPSLESLNNIATGRYSGLRLSRRAQGALAPRIEMVDLRGQPFDDGLSQRLVNAVAECLESGEQALLFVNRRGFAPVLMCHACGWQADCSRCDAHMVYHRHAETLRCHHCAAQREPPSVCPECGAEDLRALGLGTERIAEALAQRFPDARIERVDRDSVRRKGAMQALLDGIHCGDIDILVGTQMLAKGHHFPNVTLVCILDADGGLFGADFRAAERMAQLLTQVAGRAGRGERPGQVLIQTHHPDHPLLTLLIHEGYRGFGMAALGERRLAALPPFSSLALLRAEAAQRDKADTFLCEARARALAIAPDGVQVLGPVAAPMERRAGRFRAQLLLQADERGPLHALLSPLLAELEALKSGRRVRWSLDVDPQEML